MMLTNCRILKLAAALLMVAAGLVGCDYNTYDLKLSPDGKALRRELICRRGHVQDGKHNLSDFPDKELEQFISLYENHTTSDKGMKHHFQGTFEARTPNDIGGSGWYLSWESDLGTVSGYVERFRGADDLTPSGPGSGQTKAACALLVCGLDATEESVHGLAIEAFLWSHHHHHHGATRNAG